MREVTSREFLKHIGALLESVAEGQRITVTVRARPVAELVPVARRPAWISRDRFVREVLHHQADPGLAEDLVVLAGETTDEGFPLLDELDVIRV
ncbi:MAG: type II toxin-antitoxin system prevent-host-death family antitoxin [Acidimicrobiia bacterium]|nr:type II toxin-antitoxin system prevent-host-death family antitoxin [Acidimicrobiia bacterium]